MDEIRQAWGNLLKRVLATVSDLFTWLYDGISGEWNVGAFILLMAVVVIVTGISMWHRRA
jgi:hypothetical protein